MELDYFKDKVFEILNDADDMEINDIETHDQKNTLVILSKSGDVFELECRQLVC